VRTQLNEPRNIVLTGFMGTGKTTIGVLLAERLGLTFVDTDATIEERDGPIAEIFADRGEAAFRAMEHALAIELSASHGMVISTGGAMMLNPDNVAALTAHGDVFCLTATTDDILERVSSGADPIVRPLLAVADPRRRIDELLRERAAAYAQFPQVDTTGQSPEHIAGEIERLLNRGSHGEEPRTANSIAEVVANGLCVGCGLCEAVTNHRVTMRMSEAGGLRPTPVDGFSPVEEAAALAACPGTVAAARSESGMTDDDIWGRFTDMRYAWAGDPTVRFEAATGGVLTALGAHLLVSGVAMFVLHVGADPDAPTRSRWVVSESPEQVRANTGSWYGPAAPLAGLCEALDRREPFAIIAKPCDLGAVYAFAAVDPRVDEFCVARLTMVCGGQSRLEKTTDLLDSFGVAETEVSLVRYRGHGNPGPTHIETFDGRTFDVSYNDMWDDHAGWKLESRCTVCPDALGEAADVAAGDVWPGGGPTGEDEGFNGIIVRTEAGARLVASAEAAGALVLGDPITPRTYDDLQPHQVRKKIALAARYAALTRADRPTIATIGLRVSELGEQLTPEQRAAEIAGTLRRVEDGRYSG